MVTSNEAGFVCVRVVGERVVIEDVAITSQRPPTRPRACVSVGRNLIQHSAPAAAEVVVLAAEHDHSDTIRLKATALRVEDDGVLTIHRQVSPYQQRLKGEHHYYPPQQRLHAPPFLSRPQGNFYCG